MARIKRSGTLTSFIRFSYRIRHRSDLANPALPRLYRSVRTDQRQWRKGIRVHRQQFVGLAHEHRHSRRRAAGVIHPRLVGSKEDSYIRRVLVHHREHYPNHGDEQLGPHHNREDGRRSRRGVVVDRGTVVHV